MNDQLNTQIWRKDYEAFYKSHAEQDKPVYDYQWCCNFVDSRLTLPNEDRLPTLVDVGCGDGIWSIVLARYFDVTGIDNSQQGIANAKVLSEKFGQHPKFVLEDILTTDQRFEYAFCRGPEFFGGYAPETETFQLFKQAVGKLFTKTMYFIVYSKPPFSRYANEEKTSYFHDPEQLVQEFSEYGECSYSYEHNYIVLEINRT